MELSPAGRRYGARLSKPDARDLLFKAQSPLPLPSKITLRNWLGGVKDQGPEGACTGFAYSGMLEFLFRKYRDSGVTLSPQYVYYREREADGQLNLDEGADMRTGAMVITKWGACLEGDDPYSYSTFKTAPTQAMIDDGLKYRAGAYHKITDFYSMKTCLASGYCFVLGFQVPMSFEENDTAKTGLLQMPKPDEQMLGGHAVLCYGYDDSKNALLIRNSWGYDWGLEGNFLMPYEFAQNPALVYDCFIAHLGSPWVAK